MASQDYYNNPYRPYHKQAPPASQQPTLPFVSRLDPGRPEEFNDGYLPERARQSPYNDAFLASTPTAAAPPRKGLPPRPPPKSDPYGYGGPDAAAYDPGAGRQSPYGSSPPRAYGYGGGHPQHRRQSSDARYLGTDSPTPDDDAYANTRKARQYSDEIPLTQTPNKPTDRTLADTPDGTSPERTDADRERDRERRRRRQPAPKKGFFSWETTWCVYGFTLVQLTVFIAELVRNSVLTGTPIEIHPQINPMLGPSFSVLINMGARYVPCMKNVTGIPLDTAWPCPNTTTLDPSNPSNQCNIAELCGFQDFGANPNQWFRFITPIFLHAGLVHIGFNLLLQLTLGKEMERIIGSLRFLIVYMSSGIFGFVLGGNFAASGIASMGASGALFGLIAINLLDLLYTWHERVSPKKELAFIMLDIVVSFALGLLPGLDNFSHIGGFLMGLVLGICILHSPNKLRREKATPAADPLSEHPAKPVARSPTNRRAKRVSYKSFAKDPAGFFRGRKALWWVWWLVRAGAFLGVLIAFIVLLNNFYKYHDTCTWCKYLSCIDVNNWCDMGNLTAQLQNTSTNPGSSSGSSNARLLARSLAPADLSAFF